MRFLSTLAASVIGTLVAFGVVVLFGLLILFALASAGDQATVVPRGGVLVAELGGPVLESVSGDPLTQLLASEPGYDLHDLKHALRKAAADDRIDAVWIKMRGLEATWGDLQEIRQALLQFKTSGKPLIASGDDYFMDEADYYLASTADAVYAGPEALFEFNGFFLNVEFYQGLLEKLDVEPQVVRAGRFKGAVEPFLRRDLSPENELQLSELLTNQNEVFLSDLSASLDLSVEELRRLAEDVGLVTAADAYEAGLLTGLAYTDEVEQALKDRLGRPLDEALETVTLRSYVRVPDREAGLEVGRDGQVAVVYAEGAITSGESGSDVLGSLAVGAETFVEAMEEARTDERIDAVVVRIDSPGGFAPAADAMWRAMDRTRQTKPVIVSMGGVAASGGYWMATAADTIVANPLTLTGSIGVFSVFFDAGGLFENKLGITFDAVRTSPYADMFSGVRALSEAERARLQASVSQTYASFLEKVAQSQELTVEQVDEIAQGRVWTGAAAQEVGLVDVLGDLNVAIELAAERAGLDPGTYRLRELPRPKTFLEELEQTLNARAAQAWTHLRLSPTERAVAEQLRLLHTLTRDHGAVQARLPVDLTIR